MSFLSPLFLIGLLAGLVPIAIHFIRREKPVPVPFSTLRFFKKTTRKQFLFQRIQQWLLLLLRTAVVVLLALAFARPFVNENLSSWANLAPKSMVVLLDTSMSMSYPGYFERAKQQAIDHLDELNPGDQAAVMVFADRVLQTRGLTDDIEALKSFVDNIEGPGSRLTRYFPAFRAADELLKESQFEDKGIVLVSDFQAEGMVDFEPQWKLQPGVGFVTADVAIPETKNIAITGLKLPAQTRGDGEQSLYARVRSFGSVLDEEVTLTLSLDNKEQTQRKMTLSGQSERVLTLPINLTGEGSHWGFISIEGDEFVADYKFYFSVDVLPKIQVLVINGEASNDWYEDEGHWFELATQSNEQSPFVVDSVRADQWQASQLASKNVVVLLNVGRLQNSLVSALENYVRNGGNVLIAPGDRVNSGDFNAQLGAVSPATLVASNDPRRDDYLVIADMALRHPVLQSLNLDWEARFEGNWQVEANAGAEVIMSFDNGTPALLERQVGDGRVLLFASALDTEWNNLPLQGIYLPFVHEMLKYLAQTEEKQTSYTVGDRVSVNSDLSQLLDPDGNPLTLAEGANSFTLDKLGTYQAVINGQTYFYAANVPVAESELARVSQADLLDRVLNPETKPTQSAEVRTQILSEEIEKPQRLWWWLLLAVAMMLLAESFIANRTHRQ